MTKSKPQIKIINCTTGEEIVRDATSEEIVKMEIDSFNEVARKAVDEAKAQAKATLLKRLGITAEEAALLFS